MPSIDVAMAASLRGGVWTTLKDSVVRSIVHDLAQRDMMTEAANSVEDAQTAFSSWDNCMAADFCKWPVIAIMVIGGLILLAILWCCIRCLCCAKSCCCGIFHCLKCCGNCCGCCDPPKGANNKYLDEPFIPPNHGYRQEAPMQAPFPHAVASPPQYAEFDMSKKGGEDSLPAMPNWDGANSKKVMLEEEPVELTDLKKSPTSATDSHAPLMGPHAAGRSTPVSPLSPMGPGYPRPGPPPSPFGQPPAQPPQSPYGYGAPSPQPVSRYGQQSQAYGQDPRAMHSMQNNMPSGMPNNRESVGFGLDQPYDDIPGMSASPAPVQAPVPVPIPAAMPIAEMGQGRQSPALGQPPYGRGPPEPAYAEMPAAPVERGSSDGYGPGSPGGPGAGYPGGRPRDPRDQSPRMRNGAPQGYGMRRQGTGDRGPDGYGMRRAGTGESMGSRGSPAPNGMDPRMRQSPGPRRTPGPRGDPYGQQPRQSPAPQNGYGPRRPGYGPPPPKNEYDFAYTPTPERRQPPANVAYPPDHHELATPIQSPLVAPPPERHEMDTPVQSPPTVFPPDRHEMATPTHDRPFAEQKDPQSPLQNNSGFDFNSGFSRPPGEDSRPGTAAELASPAQEAYPGFKPYRP